MYSKPDVNRQFMTNINKKNTSEPLHSYISEDVKEFLEKYLPKTYTEETLRILRRRGIHTSSGVIRNVRSGLSKNQEVLNALVKLAERNRKLSEEINTIIDNR